MSVTSILYDGNGNRSDKKVGGTTVQTHGYDFENCLVTLTDNVKGSFAYAYDHRTRRVGRNESSAGGLNEELSFAGGLSVQEYTNGSGTPTVEYIRGSDYGGGIGGVLYTIRDGSSRSYNAYNSRGDVISRTNDGCIIDWQASYEAFGQRTQEEGATLDRQKANTKDEDPTGLLNEGMRYRDLEFGVFLTRDPAGFVDGPNIYTYVRQNPWSGFDPHGLLPKWVTKLKGTPGWRGAKGAIRPGAGKRGQAVLANGHEVIMPAGVSPGGIYQHTAPSGKVYDIQYDQDGFPDFSPHRAMVEGGQSEVKLLDMVGDHDKDFKAADKLAGITEEYRKKHGLTWHHHQDCETMQLVPTELNNPANGGVRHTGGAAVLKCAREVAEEMGLMDSMVLGVAGAAIPNYTETLGSEGSATRVGAALVGDVASNVDPTVVIADTVIDAVKSTDKAVDNVERIITTRSDLIEELAE